jgi:hypothetical protein
MLFFLQIVCVCTGMHTLMDGGIVQLYFPVLMALISRVSLSHGTYPCIFCGTLTKCAPQSLWQMHFFQFFYSTVFPETGEGTLYWHQESLLWH